MLRLEGNIELLTVEKLIGVKFRIPSYQRGYRWRAQHVEVLLNDLDIFKRELGADTDSPRLYSLQPLVVKKTVPVERKNELLESLRAADGIEKAEELFDKYREWEVIDGQQRLTTLFLILIYLQARQIYTITYDTRPQSATFLEHFSHPNGQMEAESRGNIDFRRMFEVYKKIETWFADKDEEYRVSFRKLILERVQFIWYESVGEKAIEVFTRLNIGNIKLTDAELIKALILDQASFLDVHGQPFRDDAQLKLARGKISAKWDEIERRLQDDSFWLYFQPYDEKKKDPPTRIDFLLAEAAKRSPLRDVNVETGVHDDHVLFHRYEAYFRAHRAGLQDRVQARESVWSIISDIYHVIEEWFEDATLYHYTGYLMAIDRKKLVIDQLLDDWYSGNRDRDGFKLKLEDRIRHSLDAIRGYAEQQSTLDAANAAFGVVVEPKTILDVVYDDGHPAKANCTPLLLLHNVLTIIQQGDFMARNVLYRGQRVFYKFPFNLYKREQWEIEHVDARTRNAIDKPKDQKDWLLSVYPFVNDGLKDRIFAFCEGCPGAQEQEEFQGLQHDCDVAIGPQGDRLGEQNDDKNKIWNFVLLDGGTNSGYGNSIFPAKRRTIMSKEQGVKLKDPHFVVDSQTGERRVEWTRDAADSPFVPPCTKQVFLQYYSEAGVAPLVWSKSDAQSYYNNLRRVLARFI